MHNDRGSSWSLVLGLGTMDNADLVKDTGLLFGVFNTGPWLAYKTPGNDIRGWVGAGKQMFDLMVSKISNDNINIKI